MNFDLQAVCKAAKSASRVLRGLSAGEKNRALTLIATALRQSTEEILTANQNDITAAKEAGISSSLLDRLTLTPARIEGICIAIDQLIGMSDPVGRIVGGHIADNGLKIEKITVPIGVIGIIYESRPNVSVDIACLCLKTGNVCILRGGKEAYHSNAVLIEIMRKALSDGGFCPDFINFVDSTDRNVTAEFMKQKQFIDCLIPRGGKGLIDFVVANSSIPVIETGAGVCHVYVDEFADTQKAIRITDNAKTSRPSVCNAAETLLIHETVAEKLLPVIKKKLDEHHVKLRCCPKSLSILAGQTDVTPVEESDYFTEFGDFIMSVKVVADIQEAVTHIEEHGTHHSDAIVTENLEAAQYFLAAVDSAAVYVNASTRFTDGGCFGMGAEIGISTQKLHARGPMGLNELVTTKYIVYGNGQIRL